MRCLNDTGHDPDCEKGCTYVRREMRVVTDKKVHVCPVERARALDIGMRRWVQNPRKILAPYVRKGMTVLDMGCGPGFFSVDIAGMVGDTGRVVVSDLQEEMLQIVGDKVRGTDVEDRVTLHKCEENRVGLSDEIDFVLAFYTVHELPDEESFFHEVRSMLSPKGQVLVVEPLFHVSKKAFERTVKTAVDARLTVVERPKMLLSRAVLLKKG